MLKSCEAFKLEVSLASPVVSNSRTTISKNDSHQLYWLALTLTPGLGPTRARRLVEFLDGIEAVFNASLTELEAAGLPSVSAQSLGTGKSLDLAHDEAVKANGGGRESGRIGRSSLSSAPAANLRSPLVLYARGDAAALSQPGIAMVGTRHPTP